MDAFVRRPVMNRNQTVRVIYRNGALTVEGEGIVQADGARGDRVPVRVGKRRRLMHAVVIDSKTVETGPEAGKESR
jgi:flagella basal body P-ring formation protein FlgA